MKDGIRPRVETFSGICRCARMGRTRAAHSPLLARAQGKAPAAAVGRRNTVQIPKLVGDAGRTMHRVDLRSEEHTSELQSLMRISYAVFCLKKKKTTKYTINTPS